MTSCSCFTSHAFQSFVSGRFYSEPAAGGGGMRSNLKLTHGKSELNLILMSWNIRNFHSNTAMEQATNFHFQLTCFCDFPKKSRLSTVPFHGYCYAVKHRSNCKYWGSWLDRLLVFSRLRIWLMFTVALEMNADRWQILSSVYDPCIVILPQY